MLKLFAFLGLALCLPTAALATKPQTTLDANRVASGGTAWTGKSTLELRYTYSGGGLTGTYESLQDLTRGAFVDTSGIPNNAGASGYDGVKAWEKEPSGTITDQSGGDVIPLAITEAYLDRHLWWRSDYGGAQVVDEGQKSEGGRTYEVLSVTPAGGKPIDAWFDTRTHLLFRTVEQSASQIMTTTYSDYAPVNGAMIARKFIIDDGSGDLQTYSRTSARFSGPLPLPRYQKPRDQLHDFSIVSGARETTVPFRLLNNHIFADVRVNDSKPLTFMFDTGGHNMITPGAAKELGIRPIGTSSGTGGGDKVVQTGQASVSSLAVGGARIVSQPVLILDFFPPGTEGLKIDGMIGYEFFARFVTRFDYAKQTITFIDKKRFNGASAGVRIPMHLFHHYPELLGSYDGVPARFGIDTGSRGTLGLNKTWAAANGIPRPGTRTAEAQTGWGVGGPTRALVFRGGIIKLGDLTIAHPLTEVSTDKRGSHSDSAFPHNVGGGLLKRFIVTLDYDRDSLFLKPISGRIPDLDTFDRSGMWINAASRGFKVISVTKGGPAEAAGLMAGDLIAAVDGKKVAESDLPIVRMKWRNQAPGTTISLLVERGTSSIPITLIPKEIV